MEVVEQLPKIGYDYAQEFEFGLDLILDGIEGLRIDHRPAVTRKTLRRNDR